MDINPQNLRSIYTGLSTAFNARFAATTALYGRVAMTVPSTGSKNEYPRLDDLPGFREWIGDRQVHDVSANMFEIVNRDFEKTIGIDRTKIEDDSFGVFTPIAEQMGQDAKAFPDLLTFGLMKKGATTLCFDGQYFFDTDHPSYNSEGQEGSASNMQAGANPAWYLVDDTQVLKPLVYQKRKDFKFVSMTRPEDPNVFHQKKFVYGVDGRANVGFGMWQCAFMSKAELNTANFEAARATFMSRFKRSGEAIVLTPRLLVVPPALEGAARRVVGAALIAGGETNVWAGTAEILVVPHLA